jgi:hypothetical protein
MMMMMMMMMMMNFNVGRKQTKCFGSCPHHIKSIARLILMFLSVGLPIPAGLPKVQYHVYKAAY